MTRAANSGYGTWHVVATHPHREAQAIENLARQDFCTYCPMTIKRIRHARRAYDARRPLFPGYVFVSPGLRQQWRPALSSPGVRSLVMSGEKPARLPAGLIENLKAREVDGILCRPETSFRVGQEVAIRGGPFDGLIGQIIEMRENDRILVLLDLLERKTRVHVSAKQLSEGRP